MKETYLLSKDFDPALKTMLLGNRDISQNIYKFVKSIPSELKPFIQHCKDAGMEINTTINNTIWRMKYSQDFEEIQIEKAPKENPAHKTTLRVGYWTINDINCLGNELSYLGSYNWAIESCSTYRDDKIVETQTNQEMFTFMIGKKNLFGKTKYFAQIDKKQYLPLKQHSDLKKPFKRYGIEAYKIWKTNNFVFKESKDDYLKFI